MTKGAVHIHVQVFVVFLLDKYPVVELLGHIIIMYFNL